MKNYTGDKNYELSNHLGNVLEVITDRKLPIEHSTLAGKTAYYTADVIAFNDYYPYGMVMPGRNTPADDYRYGFQGQEKDDEVKGKGNHLDFGNRCYDARIGRFLSTDRFEGKYADQSPYLFAANNPIVAVDVKGDSAWITESVYYVMVGDIEVQHITRTIHVTGKLLDYAGVTVGGGGCEASYDGMPTLLSAFHSKMNGLSAKQGTGNSVVHYKFDVDFDIAKSMKGVDDSDHLLTIVDDIIGEADPVLGGGDAGGLALTPGKNGYVEENSSNLDWMAQALVHELLHNLGLRHVANGSGNYMSYDAKRTKLTYRQFDDIDPKRSNSFRNYSIHFESEDNTYWHESTNHEPYDMDVEDGEKTPRRIYD